MILVIRKKKLSSFVRAWCDSLQDKKKPARSGLGKGVYSTYSALND